MTFFLLLEPLIKPLQTFLIWLNGLVADVVPLPSSVSSWAIAIIIVAVIVKLGTQPLTSKQQESMRKMQELQPKVNALQKKHKDDREKLSQAQMELYREEGVNPFGGCLPLVVQMVVLIGMWRAIMGLAATELAKAKFLWVPSLGQCEPSPMCGQELSLLPYAVPILLITMVSSQIAYQRLMTPPTQASDPQQQAMQSMMKFMPLLFAWIFIKFPAGLVLYYAAFNLVGLVQQSWINYRVTHREDEEELAADSPSGGGSEGATGKTGASEGAGTSAGGGPGLAADGSDSSRVAALADGRDPGAEDEQVASLEERDASEPTTKRRRRRRKKRS